MTAVKLVNEATALLSMRESDFDTYSAYGEAVDNSIQAGAKNIHIKFESQRESRGYERILRVAFIDDGHGMDADIIHRCLQLGYSSRFNDRTGIGRFGVGMTLGAIHECMRVDVYSKAPDTATWLSTHIDLSTLQLSKDADDVSIPDPEEKNFPSWVEDLRPESSGALVIWSEYDRQVDTASKIIEETKVWMGRTFRHYISNGVSIFVNGEKVFAIDPLYVESEATKFPSDPKAEEVEPMVIDWPVPEDVAEFEGQKSEIRIRLSLLPEEFRPNAGAGNTNHASDRHINSNQGISITRLGREVFYGPIPWWPGDSKWFSEIDRWWGCVVEFNPLLDRAFTVKNIKRGAVPNKELKKVIFEKMQPTVKHFLEQIRSTWEEAKIKKQQEEEEKGAHNTGHEGAEKIVKETPTDTTSIDVEDPKKAEQDLLERLKRERSAEEEDAWLAKWRSQPFTIEDDQWRGQEFMELKPLGGNDVLLYNNAHSFISHLNEIITELGAQDDTRSKELARQLKNLIDLLLISYTKAESKFTDEDSVSLLELLRINWGQYLKTYLKKLNEEGE